MAYPNLSGRDSKELFLTNEKIQILIVDDEPDLLEMYTEVFESEGFLVHGAPSALVALELFKANSSIQLIISDSHMKGMTGLEFLKTLIEIYKTIPHFYLATGDMDQSEESIKSLGGHGLVLKPFDVDEIIIKIKKDLNL
jgi:CheY-like chemotaxis protein